MREQLLIRLRTTDSGDTNAEWMVFDEAGNGIGKPANGPLSALTNHTDDRRVTLLAPGSSFLLTHTEMPTTDRKQIMQALPFALEESLADDPEDLHFVPIYGSKGQTQVAAAVVSHDDINHWLDSLRSVDIEPTCLIPDVLALPLHDAAWTLHVHESEVLIRATANFGFATNLDSLIETIELALNDTDLEIPSRFVVTVFGETDYDLHALEKTGIEVRIETASEPQIAEFAHTLKDQPALNILVGKYGVLRELSQIIKPWRTAAALFMVWLGLQAGLMIWEHDQLQTQHALMDEEITHIYKDSFPGSSRIVNARVQMERKLKELRQSGGAQDNGFLELLAIGGRTLNSFKQIELNGAQYRNNELTLELSADNLQRLDQFKQALDKTGKLSVELQSASSRDNVVIGRIVIQEGEGS